MRAVSFEVQGGTTNQREEARSEEGRRELQPMEVLFPEWRRLTQPGMPPAVPSPPQ